MLQKLTDSKMKFEEVFIYHLDSQMNSINVVKNLAFLSNDDFELAIVFIVIKMHRPHV